MSKQQSAERMGAALETLLRNMELDESLPMRVKMKAAGLRYVRVTVQDVDTNESELFYTWAADLVELEHKLKRFAPLPKALLNISVAAGLYDPELGMNVETHTAHGNLTKRQTLGRRTKRGGISPATAERYESIAKQFYNSNLSQIEYCREKGIHRSKLTRALRYVAKKKVSKNRPGRI